MSYQPRYADLIDIPVQIPDDYDDEQKREALEVAEGAAELDLNEGEKFSNKIPRPIMNKIKTAIKQKATAELAEGAEAPDDVTLGDLSDDGTNKSDYADIFQSQYNELIQKIKSSGVLDSEKDNTPYVYNTRGGNPRVEGSNVIGDSGGGSYQGRY